MCKKLAFLISFVLVLGLVVAGAGCASDPNLVGWWKFDTGSGATAIDSSRYGNDGTLVGDPAWVSGKIGGALEFDRYGDYVLIGNESHFDITGPITVACWIKVHQFDRGWQAIVTKGDRAWRLARSGSDDSIEFACDGLSNYVIRGNVNVNDGKWHHVAGVYDQSKISLYIDGILDASKYASGTISTTNDQVCIGENAGATARYWCGLIDDVRIYNRALSSAEIERLAGR